MKRLLQFLFYTSIVYFFISCDDNETPKPESTIINPVSQFAYDGLSTYYLWADEMEDKKPTTKDSDPEDYFYSSLNKIDTEHGWSWITDDIEGLLNSFAGKSFSFGYNINTFTLIEGKAYLFINFVYPNTPASEAGVERLHLIGEIEGRPIKTLVQGKNTYIADSDLDILFGEYKATYTLYKYENGVPIKDKTVTITPRKITENPVLLDTVYPIGNKRIGYLFYNGFTYDFNSELYKSFSKFKSKNVTDLVLDLRYNHGGAISSASYLASMIAPRVAVQNKQPLTTLSYNDFFNNYFDEKGWSRSSLLGDYDPENNEGNPLNVNLNLNKVYVIATDDSYSASELTTFCLRPYMEVIHIGSKTGGKYSASWTISPYKDYEGRVNTVYDESNLLSNEKTILANWGMQPIVAFYTDKNGENFSKDDGLIPQYELKEGFGNILNWTKLGDKKDVLLGQALYLITGNSEYTPVVPVATKSSSFHHSINADQKNSLADEILKESVIIDNITLSPKQIRELLKVK